MPVCADVYAPGADTPASSLHSCTDSARLFVVPHRQAAADSLLGGLRNLVHLKLESKTGNGVSVAGVSQLGGTLHSLRLCGNGLSLPMSSLAPLTRLESLTLQSQGLRSFPPEIAALTKLTYVCFHYVVVSIQPSLCVQPTFSHTDQLLNFAPSLRLSLRICFRPFPFRSLLLVCGRFPPDIVTCIHSATNTTQGAACAGQPDPEGSG